MTFALFAASLTLLGQPPAAAPPAPPVSPAPKLLQIRPDDQGKLSVAMMQLVPQQQTYTYVETVGGEQVTKTGVRTVSVAAIQLADPSTLKGLTFTTAGGKAVETADALKAMRAGATVAASADGKPIDAAYLKLLRDDVLVVAGEVLHEYPTAKSPAPYFLDLKTDAKGLFARTATKYVPRTETRTVNVTKQVEVEGKTVSRIVSEQQTVTVTVPMIVVEALSARELPATTPDGKPVAPADAATAYAGGVKVVVSADGKPIDAKYLKAFKDDVLVLTVKALALVSPPAAK